MALPPLASVSDLSDWLGEPILGGSADAKRAEGVLRLASALVRRETGRTWTLPDDVDQLLDPLPDDVVLVTLACAARGYTNPRGVIDASTGVDDFTERERLRVDEAGMYLSASERDLLSAFAGTANQGMSTVSTTRGERANPDLIVDDCERILPPYY